MDMQNSLPGFTPGFVRVELERTESGDWLVRTLACESRRYVSAVGAEVYEDLALAEAVDVISAALSCLCAEVE